MVLTAARKHPSAWDSAYSCFHSQLWVSQYYYTRIHITRGITIKNAMLFFIARVRMLVETCSALQQHGIRSLITSFPPCIDESQSHTDSQMQSKSQRQRRHQGQRSSEFSSSTLLFAMIDWKIQIERLVD